MEDDYLVDQEAHDRLSEVEHDLIDQYLRGELPEADRKKFETQFLASPRRERKVQFAMELLGEKPVAGLSGEGAAADRAPLSRLVLQWLHVIQQERWLALGAAALLVIGVLTGLLLNQRLIFTVRPPELPQRMGGLGRQNRVAPAVPKDSGWESQTAESPPKDRPDRVAAIHQKPSEQLATTEFLLKPSFRGDQTEPVLIIPAGTGRVILRARLEQPARNPYSIELTTVEGEKVWQTSVEARGSSVAVVLAPPAQLLRDDDYILTVRGKDAQGRSQKVAEYFFRIRR